MKKRAAAVLLALALAVFGCSAPPQEQSRPAVVLGYAQLGAESMWRVRYSNDIKRAAAESGVQLLYNEAEQKQKVQAGNIRALIAYQVDVIAFSPIVTYGWDNVLSEAKAAGIPVIITDSNVSVIDESLYTAYLGTDSQLIGRMAGEYLIRKFQGKTGTVNIVELTGPDGSSVAADRARGFRDIINKDKRFRIIRSLNGAFMRSKGTEKMRYMLNAGDDIDVLYSHNDGMTLGAVEALEEAGITPGRDVIIVSVDGEKEAIELLKKGRLNCVIENSPLQGSKLMELARKLASGEEIPREVYIPTHAYTDLEDVSGIEFGGY